MRFESRPVTRGTRSLRSAVSSAAIETLESRQLLSSSALKPKPTKITSAGSTPRFAGLSIISRGKVSAPKRAAKSGVTSGGVLSPDATMEPFTPAQLRHFYGVDGLTNQGQGQTIAIIDGYNLPTIQTDAATFSSRFGLPQFNQSGGPTLTVEGQSGSTSSLPSTTATGNYALEIALDVEWAHAMAPQANILLIECNTFSYNDLLAAGVGTANQSGASVVSMSFGGGEFSGETSYDSIFTTTGKTYLASTGDAGAANTGYPSTSPNVVAVGGTTINTADDSGTYGSEVVWNDGSNSSTGGAISTVETKPTYQSGVTLSSTKRTVADVSLEASPNTGVYVYYGGTYYEAGGTSLSAPAWAGIVADVNQARSAIGFSNLSGRAATLPRLYQLPTADYHDITSGNNNSNPALVGYDLPTGRGTPVANKLGLDLAGGNVSGTAFIDKNGDGVFNSTDAVLSGVQVYVDVNGNGAYDSGTDLSVTTGSTGAFSFSDVVGGLPIREVVPAGYVSTGSTLLGTTAYGGVGGVAAGLFPTTFTATAATNYTLRLDAAGTTEQIFVNAATSGTPTYQIAQSKLTTLAFNGASADDLFTLDLTDGNPLLAGNNVTFSGGAQTSADAVKVVGAAAGSTVQVAPTAVAVGGEDLIFSGVEKIAYAGGAGNDSVTVINFNGVASPVFSYVGGGGADTLSDTNGTFAPANDLGADGSSVALFGNGTKITFSTSQHLAALALSSGASAAFTAGTVLRTTGLSIDTANGSYLDLNTAGLVYDYSSASPNAAIAALLASGYAAGAWNGLGIRSSAAALDPSKGHALGFGEAAVVLNLTGSATAPFLGETVDATTLLVRYTRYGDANLDGAVDVADLGDLATNYGLSSRSWATGDFTYDSTVDVADLGLLATNYGLPS